MYEYRKDLDRFNEVKLGSSKLIGGEDLIKTNDTYQLITSKGENYRIWFYDYRNMKPLPLILDSIAVHDVANIKYIHDRIFIKVNDKLVIEMFKKNKKVVVIDKLDLRPIGFNIYLEGEVIHLGDYESEDFTAVGLDSMIGLT